MIEVNNISKRYGHLQAVKDVSFTLSSGDIVGFLGSNGAGKTTTMQIMAGALNADSGSVSAFGYDISKEPLKAKKKIGYLPEDNPMYNYMYVKEYLDFVAATFSVKNKNDMINEIIVKTGLKNEYKKKIGTLSKGNKQRVGLAQAFIHNPDFLILDEPTSGLDPNQQDEIHNMLSEFGKSRIILFSSHILQEVITLCNRCIIINKGQIVFDNKITKDNSLETTFRNLTQPL